jgi:hypothetical protein
MGSKPDRHRREQERVDNETHRQKIELTRGWIFEKGAYINGKWVEGILKAKSYVPTRVSTFPCYIEILLTTFQYLELFFEKALTVRLQLLHHVRRGFTARI